MKIVPSASLSHLFRQPRYQFARPIRPSRCGWGAG